MTELPDFLNRKINPVPLSTFEEWRAAYPYVAVCISETERQRELDKKLEEEERKERARARIGKMQARFAQNSQLAVGKSAIPEKYLGWDGRRQKFYDIRERTAKKLAAALREAGLDHLIDEADWKQNHTKRLVNGCVFSTDITNLDHRP